jgi:hypothetical protein
MDDPLTDRPTYGTVSGGAAAPVSAPPRRSVWPWSLVLLLVAFLLGMTGSPWFERQVRGVLPAALSEPATGTAALERRIAALEAKLALHANAAAADLPPGERLVRVETQVAQLAAEQRAAEARIGQVQGQLGGIGTRVADVGERIDAAVEGATEGAEQAQGLMLVTSARRAIEGGQSLVSLEAPLRERFAEQPEAVQALVEAGRAPVTLTVLRSRFAALRPELEAAATPGGWWEQVKAMFADIVAVRRVGDSGGAPAVRLADAQRALERGDVASAANIVARLPGAYGPADAWLAQARGYVRAQQALTKLEAGVLAPTEAGAR